MAVILQKPSSSFRLLVQKYNPTIPSNSWFYKLNLSSKLICSISRLHFGHTLLPSPSLKLSLSHSPFCIYYRTPAICDIEHIFFNCPSLSSECLRLYSLLNFLNIPLNTQHIFSSQIRTVIVATISLILNSGLLI